MIWGVRLEPGKVHSETVGQDVHLTMAAMESWDNGDSQHTKSLVFLQVRQSEFLLCTLNGVLLQQHLDMRLTSGEKLSFSVRGKNSVYLTGYSENISMYPSSLEDDALDEEAEWQDNWIHEETKEPSETENVIQATQLYREAICRSQPKIVAIPEMMGTSNEINVIVTEIKKEEEEQIEPMSAMQKDQEDELQSSGIIEESQQISLDYDILNKSVNRTENGDMNRLEVEHQGDTNIVMPSSLLHGRRETDRKTSKEEITEMRINSPVNCNPPNIDSCSPGELISMKVFPSAQHINPQVRRTSAPGDFSSAVFTKLSPHHSLPLSVHKPLDEDLSFSNKKSLHELKLIQHGLSPVHVGMNAVASGHPFLTVHPRLPSPKYSEKLVSRTSQLAKSTEIPGKNTTWKCNQCLKSFDQLGDFHDHQVSHIQKKQPPSLSEEYACRYCEKVFLSRHRLKTHEHGHEGIRPYKCQICGKGFTQSGTCRRHERIHVGFRPFKCRFCNRTFLQTKDLKKHEVFHLRELMNKEVNF